MKNKYPVTTLFLIESLDGKISSGSTPDLDVDKDWPKVKEVKDGLYQYYDIEKTTDLVSLNSGKVMAKIGINNKVIKSNKKSPCTFVLIDNKPHLNSNGIDYLCKYLTKLIIITTNENHPANNLKNYYDNLYILQYDKLNFKKAFLDLKEKHNIDSLTIQSGGTLNKEFIDNDLIDYIHIVIAPLLVGGKDTPTLIDGESNKKIEDLKKLKPLKLIECKQLKNSFIELKYEVIK